MAKKNRRFAGYKLAALPIEDISKELEDALKALTYGPKRNLPGFNNDYKVPNSSASVGLNASPQDFRQWNSNEGEKVYGNKSEIQKIVDANSPGMYTLAWGTSGVNNSDKGLKVRVAREADRRWREMIKELPEGAVVRNSPVGVSSGDYSRADLYARRGFGPVMADGQQFGLIHNGQIEPLAPFSTDTQYAQHLAERSIAAGESDIANSITSEIQRRKDQKITNEYGYIDNKTFNGLEDYRDYEDYPDWDNDYAAPDPVTLDREGFFNAVVNDNGWTNESRPPAGVIGERGMALLNDPTIDPSELELTGYSLGFEPTSGDVQAIRDMQVDSLRDDRRNYPIDAFNDIIPRPLPQMISESDLGPSQVWGSGHHPFPSPNELPREERRNAFIENARADIALSGSTYLPRDIRNHAKEQLIDANYNVGRNVIEVQELFNNQDVGNLREFQRRAAIGDAERDAINGRSPSLHPRRPPPVLDEAGNAYVLDAPNAEERMGHDVLIGARQARGGDLARARTDHIVPRRLRQAGFRGENPESIGVEWRRLLSPEEQTAVNDFNRSNITQESIGSAIVDLNDVISDLETPGGTWRSANQMVDGLVLRPPDSSQIERDFKLVQNAEIVDEDDLEGLPQAIVNLRAFTPELPANVPDPRYAPAAPHRQVEIRERPQQAAPGSIAEALASGVDNSVAQRIIDRNLAAEAAEATAFRRAVAQEQANRASNRRQGGSNPATAPYTDDVPF